MKFVRIQIILLFALVFWTCDSPFAPGPMPTELISTEYVKSLNIFGVLRWDGTPGSSFVHVERTMTTEEIYTFETDPAITDALVLVTDLDSSGDSVWTFIPSADTTQNGFYRDSTFVPVPGHRYALYVSAPELPTLTDTVSMPLLPVINGLNQSDRKVILNLVGSETIAEYEVYLQLVDRTVEKRVAAANGEAIPVQFEWSSGETPIALTIAGLDENLVSYGSSSMSFIPNTFHEDASTVTGGYGCFGAVSVITVPLN